MHVHAITFFITGPPQLPNDCRQAYEDGCRQDGVYTIDPGCGKPFNVSCDMKNGGWTVFQRRMNGLEKFHRDFEEYMSGFGQLKGDHWLGLEHIHCLSSSVSRTELMVDLVDFDGNYTSAHYSYFFVGNSLTNYRLHINGYSGTAGDSMTGDHNLNGMTFSTFLKDGEGERTNNLPGVMYTCGLQSFGAWWRTNCSDSTLNGPYYYVEPGEPDGTLKVAGVKWNTFRRNYPLKYAQMKLRPVL